MHLKKLAPAFAALAIAFTLTHAGSAMADEAAEANASEASAPTDDMYADFAKTIDAQFRPPGGGGGPGRGGGGPGHGGGGPGGGPGHGGGGPGHGGGGPGGGHGPGRRMVSCVAYDVRGRGFEGRGWDVRDAARDAVRNCERSSRARFPRCDVNPRTCR